MVRLENRQRMAQAIDQAHGRSGRVAPACQLAGIDVRTMQRWKAAGGLVDGDRGGPAGTHRAHACR